MVTVSLCSNKILTKTNTLSDVPGTQEEQIVTLLDDM